jgi:replicative superfamily II helicase
LVDFNKRLRAIKTARPIDPIELYETLDRASDKGPLRPAQESVLAEWFHSHRSLRDVIVKLHTGQGKTLIGLLILQSRLNTNEGPALYLCPDNYLIEQACEQATQFGIRTCRAEDDIPDDFINGTSILVTSVQKLFNGLTKFGVRQGSLAVHTLLMDDAHTCADRIRDACHIRIPSTEPAYTALRSLFASDLENQGVGTYADLMAGKREALLPVPYWAWSAHISDVAKILSENADRKTIKFAWPLLRDQLHHCQSVFSGEAVEIEPYIAPLDAFGSYSKAKHRVFMSATVTDDAFLIKGLQLKPDTVAKPLTYKKETWSGEKMVLLPSLIDDDLDREYIVKKFAKLGSKRRHGFVALVPSFPRSKDWEAQGANIVNKDTVVDAIAKLRNGVFERTLVLANRYDGIDLPDNTCRILIFDSRPYSENLIDLLHERCRANSKATLMRTVRTVEQGMGRSVRGEKDYSVIVVTGPDLVRLLRERDSRKFLSAQMEAQIEIGLEIAEMAKQDIEDGSTPDKAFGALAVQCLKRDEGWKSFYLERMEKIVPRGPNQTLLNTYAAELEAEQLFMAGDDVGASDRLQRLIDSGAIEADDTSWYLQERARYLYKADRPESQKLQVVAHKKQHLLLRPATGMTVAKLTIVSQGRAERISNWLRSLGGYVQLEATSADILDRLVFGTSADKFEAALNELSTALGFAGERPDAEWKEGPDNLWALDDKRYVLFECKSEVEVTRSAINKREAEQMNRSSAWFDKHYPGMTAKRVIIHPAGKIESAAAFTHEVEGMRETELKKLVKACRSFFKAFESKNFDDLSAMDIQKIINAHQLDTESLMGKYTKKLKDLK